MLWWIVAWLPWLWNGVTTTETLINNNLNWKFLSQPKSTTTINDHSINHLRGSHTTTPTSIININDNNNIKNEIINDIKDDIKVNTKNNMKEEIKCIKKNIEDDLKLFWTKKNCGLKNILGKTFFDQYFFDIFSCDEQLKKWRCH